MAKGITKKQRTISTPALVVLQWLSYVSWGLTIAALTTLAALVLAYHMDVLGWVDATSTLYAAAALVILLPVALVLDTLFSRYEDAHKSAASSVVLVIHTVLYTLIAIGALITLLFNGITQLTTTSDNSVIVAIISAALTALLVVGLVVRIARPKLVKRLRLGFRVDVAVISVVVFAFAIAGPIFYSVQTREDRALRDSVEFVASTLSSYVSQGNILPEKLKDGLADSGNYFPSPMIDKTALAKEADGVLVYKPNTQPVVVSTENDQTKTVYFYELCATFEFELKDRGTYAPYYGIVGGVKDDSGYTDYPDMRTIAPGETCYKIKATNFK